MAPRWTQRSLAPTVLVLDSPEGDLHFAIVEVGPAADAKAAAAAAWTAYRPAGIKPLKLLTARPRAQRLG